MQFKKRQTNYDVVMQNTEVSLTTNIMICINTAARVCLQVVGGSVMMVPP